MSNNYISVVMTTYNGERYIREQLNSIIHQTIVPNEIIIADDCSSDSTVEIINTYSEIDNINLILYINPKNLGYVKNFKNVISKAKGNYIFLCDQDDIWEPNKIEKTINAMMVHKASVACTGFKLIDGNGEDIKDIDCYKSDPISGYSDWSCSIKRMSLKRLIWGNFCPGCTYCFTDQIASRFNGLSNIELSHDFQILLIGANRNSAIFIDEPLSKYRLHGLNTVGMNNKEPKRVRHFQPRMTRFLNELTSIEQVHNLVFLNFFLYLRLPKIRSVIIHKLHLNNNLNLR